MNKQVFSLLLLLVPFASFSQVGVGTNNVDPSAKFQIESGTKGFLQPRVALTGTDDVTTTGSRPATGLMVYNTATAGSGATAITPGVHYFDGTRWVRMESSVINAGTGTSVTGTGTSANPYVVNSTGGGSTPVTFVTGNFFRQTENLEGPRTYQTTPDGAPHAQSMRIGSITLPEGKWDVNLHVETIIRNIQSLGGTCRIKLQFWVQNDATVYRMRQRVGLGGGATIFDPPVNVYPPAGGGDTLLRGSAAFTFTLNNGDTYCKGSFLINNTSGGNKTYYIFASEIIEACTSWPTAGSNLPEYIFLDRGDYTSNRLYATKIN